MKPNNIISNSLKESFSIIKKNKKIFLLLFILQVIFISLISFINVNYQTKMLQSTKSIIEYLDELNTDETSFGLDLIQRKSPLGPDPLLISRNFNYIIYNLQFLLAYSLIIFILLNGFIWFLTSNLVYKKSLIIKKLPKEFFVYVLKFGFIMIIFSFLIYLFGYSTLKSFLNPLLAQTANFTPLLLITLALFYFIYIAFSLLSKIKLKYLIRNLFKIGIKKAHIILSAYIIIIIVISTFSSLSFYLIEKNLFLLFISTILTILTLIWSRIFLILVVEKLS